MAAQKYANRWPTPLQTFNGTATASGNIGATLQFGSVVGSFEGGIFGPYFTNLDKTQPHEEATKRWGNNGKGNHGWG